MQDKIDKNLELKFGIFLALLGGWFYSIKFLYSLVPIFDHYILVLLVFCASYIVFYPLFQLIIMLFYISLYQVEDNKKEILEKNYLATSRVFWKYWSVLLLFIPFFIFIKALAESFLSFLVFCILGVYLFWRYVCKKYWEKKELKNFLLWFFVYLLVYLIFISMIYEAISSI